MPANPAIPRDRVHALAEACADEGEAFQSTAARLVKQQRRLSRYIEKNVEHLGPLPAQVALYMLTVTMRIFEQVGGRMRKASGRDLDRAAARIAAVTDALLPADSGFPERARAVEWRAQPHILDEILWALYERDDDEKREGEVDLEDGQSALVYLVLWLAVEALDANWSPPPDFTG
ncbi:MAG: hypothetical protein D6798_20625 [Deltaproteobacteria bacterium]|nr:MAG: hypothetical protein D6798_20625 [Deltaproteobacteria bacterium]